MSQSKGFLNFHQARLPITPNQQGIMEMRDELLLSVGSQNMDTSGYQVSEQENIEFHWEVPDLNMNAAFRAGIDTPLYSSTFDNFELGSMIENRILMDEEQDKENSSPPTKRPVSDRSTQPPVLMRCCLFWTRIENFANFCL